MSVRTFVRQLPQNISRRAYLWRIDEKLRHKATGFLGRQDFSLTKEGAIRLKDLAAQPLISLYALDHYRQEAIFVETPVDVDLTSAPFLYQAQYEQAQRVITLPYRLLHELAALLPPPSQPLIFIHSVGRCGSTLLSNVFKNLDHVVSLSEPDAFTGIVRQRRPDGSNDAEIRQLLASILRLQCRPLWQDTPRRYVIKFRSFSTTFLDLLHETAPAAVQIFLYRHAEDRARSAARAFKTIAAAGEQMNADNLQKRAQFVPLLRQAAYAHRAREGALSPVEISMLSWLSGMEQILDLQEAGVPIIPIRYEDMIAAPREIITQLFARCGIAETEVETGIAAFQQDSQKGSVLAQVKLNADKQNQFTAAHSAQLQRLLDEHPRIKDADFRIPQTLSLTHAR